MITGRKYSASNQDWNLILLLSAFAINSESGMMITNMPKAMIVVFQNEVINCSLWNMFS